MQKSLLRILIPVLQIFIFYGLSAQVTDNSGNVMATFKDGEAERLVDDTTSIIVSDSLLLSDTLSYIDTTFTGEEELPDENPARIFIDKMDSLANSWYIKHMFHADTAGRAGAGNYPSDLPDSVYIERLQAIQQVIPLSYNKLVKNFIQMYTEKKRSLVEIILGLSAYYFPVFEEVLDKNEMPLELKYLPVIESALNPKARSRAGANGLWQFMYRTGRQYNLEITSFVDERSDPLKSTEAAVRYLGRLYDVYGDWHLAIAAYNCGPGNVNRAVRRAGNKVNYWDIYYFLPRETREFVPAFIAASYVMNYYKDHNLMPLLPDVPLVTDTVLINRYLHFDQITASLNIGKEELRSLNPMYRRDVIPAKPDRPYPLILPESKILDFISKDTLIYAYDRDKYFPDNTLANPATLSASDFIPADVEGKAKIVYTIKSGDNIGFISSWFNVRTADLRYWNNIHRNLIRAGQKLVIYVSPDQKEKYEKLDTMTFAQKQAMAGKTTESASAIKPEPEKQDPGYEYYTVKNGDTIWEIAGRYAGISPDDILKLNNLTPRSRLRIGQKLKIRAKQNI
jgi:membrane-bound lytic murein transglycosylase D